MDSSKCPIIFLYTVPANELSLPLIEPETIRGFAEAVSTGAHAAAILTMTPHDPFGYGRIELDGNGAVTRIIEQKDCTPKQSANLLECNCGCYAFDGAQLAAQRTI